MSRLVDDCLFFTAYCNVGKYVRKVIKLEVFYIQF